MVDLDVASGASMRMVVATLSGLSWVCFASGAAGQTILSEADIRSQLLGKSLQYSDGAVVRFEEDGSYSAVTGGGGIRRGRWAMGGDKICVEYTSSTPYRCFQFSRVGDRLQVMTPWSRNWFGVTLTSRDPHTPEGLRTLVACEQRIRYVLTDPSPSVSSTARSFAGVWVGQWEGSRCGALIVEQILASDAARVLVAWGSYVRSRPGYMRVVATIQGNTLTASGENDSWDFALASSSSLDAKFHSAGVTTGKLTRQE